MAIESPLPRTFSSNCYRPQRYTIFLQNMETAKPYHKYIVKGFNPGVISQVG